jgi:hypothetical protein
MVFKILLFICIIYLGFFFWKTQTYQMLPRHPEEQFKRCKEIEVKPIFFFIKNKMLS